MFRQNSFYMNYLLMKEFGGFLLDGVYNFEE